MSLHLSTAETIYYIRFAHEKRTMKFRSLILLLGACFPHWTTSSPVRSENYQLDIDAGTLNKVTIIVNSSDLDLSGLQLKRISKNAFDNLAHIKTLNLSNNSLRSLPSRIFSKLINLEELSLANNGIVYFNRPFIGLDSLKLLDVSHNRIGHFHQKTLIGLKKSTEIIIEGNHLDTFFIDIPRNSSPSGDESFEPEIDDEDDEEPRLENFRVKLCKTDDGTVESLEELKQNEALGNCLEVDVDEDNEGNVIKLNNRDLQKFKRGWYKLSADSIRMIDLSGNKIAYITSELLNDLPSSLLIDLSYNKINKIKRNIIENKHCLKLNLEGNSPLEIEDGAFEKICLTEFSVANTGLHNSSFITTLPVTIKLLVLNRNGISEIPSNTFRNLKNLRELHLAFNNLENIELGAFSNTKNLSVIELAGNKIRQLNFEVFKDSPVLRTINLSSNKIKTVTNNISLGLKHLQGFQLILADNEIDSIEEGSFSNLNMSMLNLNSNKITDKSIVKGAFNMCTVEDLQLGRNPLTNLNGESFSGMLQSYGLSLNENHIKSIKNFAN